MIPDDDDIGYFVRAAVVVIRCCKPLQSFPMANKTFASPASSKSIAALDLP